MAALPSFDDWRRLAADPAWAAAVEEPGDGFALFVACDATKLGAELIEERASYCIDRGLFWVSTWGADCERVHDIFDRGRHRPGRSAWNRDVDMARRRTPG